VTTIDRVRLGKRVTKRGYVTVHSDVLNLDFRAKVSDPRAARLEMFVSAMEYMHLNRGSKVRRWP
jgi:hypothetical protein